MIRLGNKNARPYSPAVIPSNRLSTSCGFLICSYIRKVHSLSYRSSIAISDPSGEASPLSYHPVGNRKIRRWPTTEIKPGNNKPPSGSALKDMLSGCTRWMDKSFSDDPRSLSEREQRPISHTFCHWNSIIYCCRWGPEYARRWCHIAALYTGMRIGEVCTLKWDYWHPDAQQLLFRIRNQGTHSPARLQIPQWPLFSDRHNWHSARPGFSAHYRHDSPVELSAWNLYPDLSGCSHTKSAHAWPSSDVCHPRATGNQRYRHGFPFTESPLTHCHPPLCISQCSGHSVSSVTSGW